MFLILFKILLDNECAEWRIFYYITVSQLKFCGPVTSLEFVANYLEPPSNWGGQAPVPFLHEKLFFFFPWCNVNRPPPKTKKQKSSNSLPDVCWVTVMVSLLTREGMISMGRFQIVGDTLGSCLFCVQMALSTATPIHHQQLPWRPQSRSALRNTLIMAFHTIHGEWRGFMVYFQGKKRLTNISLLVRQVID